MAELNLILEYLAATYNPTLCPYGKVLLCFARQRTKRITQTVAKGDVAHTSELSKTLVFAYRALCRSSDTLIGNYEEVVRDEELQSIIGNLFAELERLVPSPFREKMHITLVSAR